MRFVDLLSKPNEISGEVVTEEFESRHSFEWGDYCEFTDYGKEYFKEILNSEITINIRNGLVITLLNPKITEERYHKFMETVAGYVSVDFFDKCLKKVN